MSTYQGKAGTVLQINLQLLESVLFLFTAWGIWPSSPEWWGFGLISILLVLSAFGMGAEALRSMGKLYARDKIVAEYMAQGNKPKTNNLASSEALRKAGMIHEQ